MPFWWKRCQVDVEFGNFDDVPLDAGLAKVIDRELISTKWQQRILTPSRPSVSRPKTPLPVERPPKVDASSQVVTLVIQPRPERAYYTDWTELTTHAAPVTHEEPFIEWLAIDLRPQPKPHKCGEEATPTPSSHPPSPSPSSVEDELAIHPPADLPDEDVLIEIEMPLDELAVQPTADLPSEDVPKAPLSRSESPARMMTPDAEDVLTGCEDPSLMLGPDDISPVVVLQWSPVVIQSDTSVAQPLDFPVVVSQCPEPSDHVLPFSQNLDPQQVIQELAKKWEQISIMELLVEMPHSEGTPLGNVVMEQNEVPSTAEMVKQASDHSVVSAGDDQQKQQSDYGKEESPTDELGKHESDHNEASPYYETVKQMSYHDAVSQTDETVKQGSDENEVSPTYELAKKVSDQSEVSPTDDVVKDENEILSTNAMAKLQLSGRNMVSAKDDAMQKKVSGHKELSLTNDSVKQESDHHHNEASPNYETVKQESNHEEVSPTDETIRQASGQNEATEELQMLKQVFGEEVLSTSTMEKIQTTLDINSGEAEFTTTKELQGSAHSDTSVKKVSSSYKEVEDVVESGKGAEGGIVEPEEEEDDDVMKSEEKEKKSGSTELLENDKLQLDEDKEAGNTEEDGDKQHSPEDVEKPASDKTQIAEQDRVHVHQKGEHKRTVNGTGKINLICFFLLLSVRPCTCQSTSLEGQALPVSSMAMMLTFIIISIAGICTWMMFLRKNRNTSESPPIHRVRNRKIVFHSRQFIRKLSEGRRQRMASMIAKRLLRLRKKRVSVLIRDPVQSMLSFGLRGLDSNRLSDIKTLLRKVGILRCIKESALMEISRYGDFSSIPAKTFLFRLGDNDINIYVVETGRIGLYIAEPGGARSRVKQVVQGESINSMFSILDVMSGCQTTYKTVFAVAEVDSTVLRLPMKTLRNVLDRYPESMMRLVQHAAMRLHRLTFLALQKYLDLSNELFNRTSKPVIKSDPSSFSVVRAVRKPQDDGGSSVHPKETPAKVKEEHEKGLRHGMKPHVCPDRQGLNPKDRLKSPVSSAHEYLNYSRRQSESNEKPVNSGSSVEKLRSTTNSSKGCARVPSGKICKEGAAAAKMAFSKEADRFWVRHLADLLGIADEALLKDTFRVMSFAAGTTLVREGEHEDSLFLTISGSFKVKQQLMGNTKEQRTLYTVQPGELVGSLAVLTGEPSLFTIETETDPTIVLAMDKKDFYALLKQKPQIVLNMGQIVLGRMSPFVRQIDFALDWVFIEAGRALYRQEEKSDCVYIVLNGRLRAICNLASDGEKVTEEYRRGELVGLQEVLTRSVRLTTNIALRDTELARIPDGLLRYFQRSYPRISTRLTQLLSQQMVKQQQKQADPAKISTIAVVPASNGVPLTSFTRVLHRSLDLIRPALCLSHASVQARLGSSAFDCVNSYRLSSWLSQQEDFNQIVVYQSDFRLTSWTHLCLRQADCVLVVAVADGDHSVGELEHQLEMLSSQTQKKLVLLHREGSTRPRDTQDWLSKRSWMTAHYHIRCPADVLSLTGQRSKVRRLARTSDFSRLARVLTGTAVGVVLSGGAALGFAHVGFLRSMIKADIPIDFVGGTSVGALMGALWAQETNFCEFRRLAKEWSTRMSSYWSLVMDITYPITSMFSGRRFNRNIEFVLRDCTIQDLWLPYFCTTTDLTTPGMRIHKKGCLWRYTRSSMSVAGLLPPMCDPEDGHILVDGGYIDNLPADAMKDFGAKTILAIDVSGKTRTDFTNYGDELSGWYLLCTRLLPWLWKPNILGVIQIYGRLACISSEGKMEAVKTNSNYDYVRLPVNQYSSLQFSKFEELEQVGFEHGQQYFQDWESKGRIAQLFERSLSGKSLSVGKECEFMNLAAFVNRNTPVLYTSLPCGREEETVDQISISSEPIISVCLEPTGDVESRANSEGASMCSLLESCSEDD